MLIHNMLTTRLFLLIGIWRKHIVNGAVQNCQRKGNGKKLRAEMMDEHIPGEKPLIAVRRITWVAPEIRRV